MPLSGVCKCSGASREKLKAWKGRAKRRGKPPTLAFEQDGDSALHQPPYSSLKRSGGNRKTFTEIGTQNQGYTVFC